MKSGCVFCLAVDHVVSDCGRAKAMLSASAHGIIDPMASEDPQDQLALRIHRLRAALRGALADLHAAGLSPSQATKDLIAEEFADA